VADTPQKVVRIANTCKREAVVAEQTKNEDRCVSISSLIDRLCALVVRVSGYRSRGPGLDSRRFQIF
jgi:hypothetical protein